jgi:hypothetical protein
MQFNASFSGANSGSGNEGWCRKMNRRLVIASISVSRFSNAVSRVRRISAGENRLKISSVDSGSSQNYMETISVYKASQAHRWLTDAQYGSSAGMTLSSESLKMPCLNTSFESEAPILGYAWHLLLCWRVLAEIDNVVPSLLS